MSNNEVRPSANKMTPGAWGAAIVFAVIIVLIMNFCSGNSDNPEQPNATKAGLTGATALVACKKKANVEAPYGFDYKTMNTDMTTTDDKITIVFNDAEVGTAMGGQLTQTIRCDVGGTDDAPSIISFGAIS